MNQLGLFTAAPIPTLSRAGELEEQARAYLSDHPEVWRLFCAYTLELIRAGRGHYGAKAIVERIRWHHATHYAEADEPKINNNFTAVFARLFAAAYPEHAAFFRTRERASERKPRRKVA